MIYAFISIAQLKNWVKNVAIDITIFVKTKARSMKDFRIYDNKRWNQRYYATMMNHMDTKGD